MLHNKQSAWPSCKGQPCPGARHRTPSKRSRGPTTMWDVGEVGRKASGAAASGQESERLISQPHAPVERLRGRWADSSAQAMAAAGWPAVSRPGSPWRQRLRPAGPFDFLLRAKWAVQVNFDVPRRPNRLQWQRRFKNALQTRAGNSTGAASASFRQSAQVAIAKIFRGTNTTGSANNETYSRSHPDDSSAMSTESSTQSDARGTVWATSAKTRLYYRGGIEGGDDG